ncbi:MAG: mechanosensitive ion channel domain-containing protein [Acidobacteriota bacterium]
MLRALATTWLTLCLVAAAAAQASTLVPDASRVTSEDIEAALEKAAVDQDLDEETRGELVDRLRDARAHLRSRQSADAAAAAHAASVLSAPRETQRLRSKLENATASAPTAESLGFDQQTPLSILEGMLTSALVELAAVEARLISLDTERAAEADRPAAIRERLAELRIIQDTPVSEETPTRETRALADARRLAEQLEQEARAAEILSLEQELLSHGVRSNLIEARRDDAAREITQVRLRVDGLQSAVNARRQRMADQAREQAVLAELAAADEHSAVRSLAEENARLTRELPTIATEIQRITSQLAETEGQAQGIEQSLNSALTRLEIGGVNQLLGRLLVEQQRSLPRVSLLRAERRERRSTLSDASLAQMQSEEQRRELTPVSVAVERVMARVTDISDPEELQSIRNKVELLLQDRRNLLQQLSSSYASQASALIELDLAQNRLLDAVAAYERFLDRNLLWIPTATMFGVEQVRRLSPAAAWMIEPSSWTTAANSLSRALRRSLVGSLSALLALGLALVFRRSVIGAAAAGAAEPASGDGNSQESESRETLRRLLGALALAALRVSPLPFLMAVLAWVLQRSPEVDDFTASVASAAAATAPFLFGTLWLRTLAARAGVLRVHFGWQVQHLNLLRRQANRLTALGVPLALVSALAYSAPITAHGESLGRLSFVLFMLVVSGVAHALMSPTRGLAVPPDGDHRANPLLAIGHAAAVGAPLLLALASFLGYSYTALTLAGHLIDTYWLGFVFFLSRLVARRWLSLVGRRLTTREVEAEPEPTVAGDPQPSVSGLEGEIVVPPSRPPDPDTVDRQSKRLLDAGLAFIALLITWAIWSDVLPALGVLDRTELWSQTVIVDGEEAIVPVTLADLLLALLIAGVTMVAARNLPGLLELLILRRRDLQAGSRYAINTLLRYVIVLIGTVATFSVIGWNWSQIQWLAAAISVGLGFGLQEIVANFVSGLVLHVERPVRVGDTVTVGQITGTISRIRFRATTITDWDRREIIVPNKSLITDQVINWTLTDPITRIVIPVGIGYGSDVEQARDVMARTLRQLPEVLDEPSPQVFFVGFGESSLDFKLHVYARQLADRLPLIHSVHEEILRALREKGIEIPFPQRDVHMK